MVLGDFFKDFFSKRKSPSEEFGITGLPRDIENDLANQRKNAYLKEDQQNQENWHREWQGGFPGFSIFIRPDSENDNDDEFFQIEQNMMRQLEDMMGGLFTRFGDLPQLEGPHFGHEEDYENKEPKSLRDKMLKQDEKDSFGSTDQFQITPFPRGFQEEDQDDGRHSMMDWSWTFPFGNMRPRRGLEELQDKDFDGEVESDSSKLDDIIKSGTIKPKEETPERFNGNFSFHKFSSITTKKSADGIIESQKTVRDSEGNEEVTVIRKIGDQEYKKTTKKDKGGNEETNENLINMDEGDLEKFEDAWLKSKTQGQGFQFPGWNVSPDNEDAVSGRTRDGFMDFFFPWKGK